MMRRGRRIMLNEQSVRDALRGVIDPDFGQDIVSLGFVKSVSISGGNVSVTIELTTPACPMRERFKTQITNILEQLPEVKTVTVNLTARSRKPQRPELRTLDKVKSLVAVSACKGGVGKSTVAAFLARALQREGLSVGLLDADIYGPSAPTLFKVQHPEIGMKDNFIIPANLDGLAVMSIGFVLGDAPAVLRGPIISNYLTQLIYQTAWGELDYLIIDLPPGTGDIQLTLVQQVALDGAIIVTTPQALSLVDVARGIVMFEKVNVPVLGVVENLCSFTCDGCGKTHYPFGRSQRAIQERFGLPTLAELPILSGLTDAGSRDSGREIEAFAHLAESLHRAVGKSRVNQVGKPEVSPTPETVVVRWPDGFEKAFNNFELRCACPCARCVDEHTGEKLISPLDVPPDVWVESMQFLGNYAVAFQWSDGHTTGIYSWEYLRKLATQEVPNR